MKKAIFLLLLILFAIVVVGALSVRSGWWSVDATSIPPGWEKSVAQAVLRGSLGRQSAGMKNPMDASNDVLLAGLKIFKNNCAGCHGSYRQPSSWGSKNFYPRVPQFTEHAPGLTAPQMFFAVKHGIRYSGMGAWEGMLSDEEIWSVATFLEHLDSLPPEVRAAWETKP